MIVPQHKTQVLANVEYLYYQQHLFGKLKLKGAVDRTIYCASGSFMIGDNVITSGMTVRSINYALTLTSVDGAELFVVQVPTHPDTPPSATCVTTGHHTVTKPWGKEIWLTDRDCSYVLKRIEVNEGHKTSLQYHEQKEETIFLYQGSADLVRQKNFNVSIDDVKTEDLETLGLFPKTCVHFEPRTLHRMCARTSIVMLEASTPHLDDVIRVQDDTNRPHGHIETEHQ